MNLRPFSDHQRGLFISVDGPSGAGKSTVVHHLAQMLVGQGENVHVTAEPSTGPIGTLARELTETVTGHALACLYAADRYHHIDTEIRPQLEDGTIVISDRYIPSGLAIQRFDGIDPAFLWQPRELTGAVQDRTAWNGALHAWRTAAIPPPPDIVVTEDADLSELAAVAAGLTEHFDTWFWLRYADTTHGPHIRARFHGHPAALGGHLLPALSAWCSEMIRQRLSGGFTVESYDQEIERYGGPDAIHAAEQVFAADSHLVLKALAATIDPDQPLVIAALSAATIARTVADGDPAALRGHHLDRAARQRVATLCPQVRSTRSRDDTSSPIPSLTDPAWTARQDALVSYRNTLKPAHRPSCASALIHMHANRLLGSADTERMARALATDLLALPPSAP